MKQFKIRCSAIGKIMGSIELFIKDIAFETQIGKFDGSFMTCLTGAW